MKKNIFCIIFFCFCFINGYSQTNIEFTKQNFPDNKKELTKAIRLIKKGDECLSYQLKGKYAEALTYYLEANNYNTYNALLNYKIGVCYTESFYKNNSLIYFQSAKKINPIVTDDIDYYLGIAYQYNLQFEKAIESYKTYLSVLPKKDYATISPNVEKRITECKYGINFIKNKNKLPVVNLGSVINSMWDDYSPVVSANDSIMAFTTKRKPPKGNMIDKFDYLYYEDVLFSYKDADGKWSTPVNPGKPINTSKNDGCVDISRDGKIITLYKNSNLQEFLAESRFVNDKWTKPVKLSKEINQSFSTQNSATYSVDRKTIYFTSESKRNRGLDIYTSTMNKNGKWGRAMDMGKLINTPYDEDGVFLANDSLLYFSSKGHNSMGDYDIFFTKKVNGKWAEPVNMGCPMNSSGPDMFLFYNGNGDAYFSSDRQDGYGGMDIYFVKIIMTPDEILAGLNPVRIKSQFVDDVTNEVVNASASVKEVSDNKIIFDGQTDSTGTFDIMISSTKEYSMLVSLKGCDEILNQRINDGFGTKYTVEYNPENRKNDKIKPTIINGQILNEINRTPVQPTIDVIDLQNNKAVATIIPDTLGYFSLTLPSEMDYKFIYKTTSCFHKRVITQVTEVNYAVSNINGSVIKLENVYFDFDRHDIRSDAIEIITRHAALFNQHKDWKISVEGHTDNMGSVEYNYFLSKNRATAVADYLNEKGVKKSRVKIKSFGYDKPATTNNTEESRQLNRRVEFKVYK